MLTWPPTYQVKRHKRAKYVKLRASSAKGLEITIPMRYALENLREVIEAHKPWILQQLAKNPPLVERGLPDFIQLNALNAQWAVQYQVCQSRLTMFERPDREIILLGKGTELKSKQLLIAWIKSQAKAFLSERLSFQSQRMLLPFQQLTIRDQQTVWGSCTANKNISLNYKLVFLPPEIVDYVLVHELAHTVHLNHSAKFWSLVAQFDQDWRLHRKSLRECAQWMPRWIT